VQVIVPLKKLEFAKTRLAALLDKEERAGLAQIMAEDVLQSLLQSERVDNVSVLTSDNIISQLSSDLGCSVIEEDSSKNLNENLSNTVTEFMQRKIFNLLIIPGDLPHINHKDIDKLITEHVCDITLCRAERDSGTNVFLSTTLLESFPFQYGINSVDKHIRTARALNMSVEIKQLPSFSRDMDTPDDLLWLLESDNVCKTKEYLRQTNISARLQSSSFKEAV